MDKAKILLVLYIASLISATSIGYKDIGNEVMNILNNTGIFKTLNEHEKRIMLLEEQFKQFKKGLIEMENEELIMKLAKRIGEPVKIKNISCYPEENICLIEEE